MTGILSQPDATQTEAVRAELDAVHADLGDAVARNLTLEERVAFAEQARDNALAQRDEAKETAKAKGQRAGEEIGRLKRELDIANAGVALVQSIVPPDGLVIWLKGIVACLPNAHADDIPFELHGSGLTMSVLRDWLGQFDVAAAPAAKPPTAANLTAVVLAGRARLAGDAS